MLEFEVALKDCIWLSYMDGSISKTASATFEAYGTVRMENQIELNDLTGLPQH